MKPIIVVTVCLWAGLASAQEPAPAAVANRVAILDSRNVELGPWFEGAVMAFVDGAVLQNWDPGDTTAHAGRWMAFYLSPGNFQIAPRVTFYAESGCVGQPYMQLAAWFDRPTLDYGFRVFSVGDSAAPEVIAAKSKRTFGSSEGACQAIYARPDLTWAPMYLGKLLTFEAADLGFVGPFHAAVVPERTGTDSVARERVGSVSAPRAR